MKRTPKHQKPEKPTSGSVLDAAISTLALGVDAIREEIELIDSGKAKGNGHDKGSRIAFLTGKVGTIADSVRKIEAARSKNAERVTRDQVIAFARRLGSSERAQLVREIESLDSKGGVLG